jgi:hypothetical protein
MASRCISEAGQGKTVLSHSPQDEDEQQEQRQRKKEDIGTSAKK